jgi:hypothetical protein
MESRAVPSDDEERTERRMPQTPRTPHRNCSVRPAKSRSCTDIRYSAGSDRQNGGTSSRVADAACTNTATERVRCGSWPWRIDNRVYTAGHAPHVCVDPQDRTRPNRSPPTCPCRETRRKPSAHDDRRGRRRCVPRTRRRSRAAARRSAWHDRRDPVRHGRTAVLRVRHGVSGHAAARHAPARASIHDGRSLLSVVSGHMASARHGSCELAVVLNQSVLPS